MTSIVCFVQTGGNVLSEEPLNHGFFVEPTVVVDLPKNHRFFREELFVPLLAVARWIRSMRRYSFLIMLNMV